MMLDELNRPVIPDETKFRISEAFTSLPSDKRGALLVLADLDGNAQATVAARFGDHWRVAGGAYFSLGERRPAGYVALEGSW